MKKQQAAVRNDAITLPPLYLSFSLALSLSLSLSLSRSLSLALSLSLTALIALDVWIGVFTLQLWSIVRVRACVRVKERDCLRERERRYE